MYLVTVCACHIEIKGYLLTTLGVEYGKPLPFYILFHDLLLRSYLRHFVCSGMAGRISLQTTVIDNCHKRVCIYKFTEPHKAKFHYASWFGASSEPASVMEFGL